MEEARLRELASVQMEKQREKVQRKPWPYISLKKKKNLALQPWGPASLTSVGQIAGWKPSGRSKAAVLKQNVFFLTELSGLKALQLIGRGPPSPLLFEAN